MGNNLKSTHKEFKKKSKKTLYKGLDTKTKQKDRIKPKLTFMEELSNLLHLPTDLLTGAPIVTATGQHELCVENHKSIIEYNNKTIKLQAKNCKILIEGSELSILYYTENEMRITGMIDGVYYQR